MVVGEAGGVGEQVMEGVVCGQRGGLVLRRKDLSQRLIEPNETALDQPQRRRRGDQLRH